MKKLYFRNGPHLFEVQSGCGGYAYELITLKRKHGRELVNADYQEVAHSALKVTKVSNPYATDGRTVEDSNSAEFLNTFLI